MFKKEALLLIPAETFLMISVIMSLRSCIFKQVKAVTTEKTNLSFSAKLIVFLWSTTATLRRILCLIIFFVPSMGLFDTLHHWRAERIPFKIRKDKATNKMMTSNDTLAIFNLTEKVLWTSTMKN